MIVTTPNTSDDYVCYKYEVFVKCVSIHEVVICYCIIKFQLLNSQSVIFVPVSVWIIF
jgi:hypothetical protein